MIGCDPGKALLRHSNFHGEDFNVLRIVKPEKKILSTRKGGQIDISQASNHLFLRSFSKQISSIQIPPTHDNYYLWIITRSEP